MYIYPYLQRADTHKRGSGGPSAKASTNNGIVLSEITSTAKGDLISAISEPISINTFNIYKFLESFKVFSCYKAVPVSATNMSVNFRKQIARNEFGQSDTGTLTQL